MVFCYNINMEKIQNIPNPAFVFPEVERESTEIQRVAKEFAHADQDQFLSRFIETARESQLTQLSEDVWSNLENTDSFDVNRGDWDLVNNHAVNGHPHRPRDWKLLKSKMENNENIEAPMLCKFGDRYHLVSGNTRLMVARALGVMPSVLMVDIS